MTGDDVTRRATDSNPDTDAALRQLVYHTDARVSAMEGQLTNLGNGQLRQEQKMDQLINHLGKPKEVNWAGWAAFGLACMIGLFAGNNAIVTDTELRLQPVRQDVESNYMHTEAVDRRLRAIEVEAAQAIGIQKLVIGSMQEHGSKLDSLNARMAASEKDRENLHKMQQDTDRYGSRNWMQHNKGNGDG